MTSEEHLAAAEQLLEQTWDPKRLIHVHPAQEDVSEATAHALVAIAIELGAPHGQPPVADQVPQ